MLVTAENLPEVPDALLIVASGDDPRAFRELYDRWAERLLAYFYGRVLDAEVAADLLAETFAVAYERRRRFRDIGRPGGAWLTGCGRTPAADCVAPDEMVERVQAVLERTGWAGWRAVLRPGGDGPCGRVRRRGGLPDLLLSPFMDTAARELSVAAGPPRSLDRRLYGRESLVVDLFEASGRRCFTLPGLQEHVRSVLAVTGRKVTFKQGRLPANSGMEPPRGDRYAEGCAIVVGAAPLYPSPGEIILEVEIWQRAGLARQLRRARSTASRPVPGAGVGC